jgi:hypothetical protein
MAQCLMKRGRALLKNLPGDIERYVDISVEISKASLLGGSAEIQGGRTTVPPGKSSTYPAHYASFIFQRFFCMIWYKPNPVPPGKLVMHIIDSVALGWPFPPEYSIRVLRRKKWDGQGLILGTYCTPGEKRHLSVHFQSFTSTFSPQVQHRIKR